MSVENTLLWTFTTKCQVPNDINNMLVEGEIAKYAYKTVRDVAIFTNKRLIVRDAQGLTGRKLKFIPYLILRSICILQKMRENYLT